MPSIDPLADAAPQVVALLRTWPRHYVDLEVGPGWAAAALRLGPADGLADHPTADVEDALALAERLCALLALP